MRLMPSDKMPYAKRSNLSDRKLIISHPASLAIDGFCVETLEFSFGHVFKCHTTQKEVFKEMSLLVPFAIFNYPFYIFAFGLPGSDKTYTMEDKSS